MKKARGQRGAAFLMVLVFLTMGTLLIVPALRLAAAGLHAERVSEEYLTEQDTADAAVMDALWQILRDGALSQIDPETGQYVYDFELDLSKWNVTIEIPSLGTSEWQAIKVNMFCKIDVEPKWLEAEGEQTFRYIFRLDMPSWEMEHFSFLLPEGLEYDSGSAVHVGPAKQIEVEPDAAVNTETDPPQVERLKDPAGWVDMAAGDWVEVAEMPDPPQPDTWYLLKTWEDDKQKLTWAPAFEAFNGLRTYIMVFEATGSLSWGFHHILPSFSDGVTVYPLEQTAAIASAMYNVIIESAGQTISAVIGITAEGEIMLVSYHVVR